MSVPRSARPHHRHRRGGFGAGALITAPVASRLIQTVGVFANLAYLGFAYFISTIIASLFMRNPPEGWELRGMDADEIRDRAARYARFRAFRSAQGLAWWALWLILFLNTSAGIAIISRKRPFFEELTKVSAIVAGGNGRSRQSR